MGEIIPYKTSHSLKTGGGDGTFDDMEARVKALEDRFDKIDSKLNTIVADVSYLKGKFENSPTGKEFGELKGKVEMLPTTAKVATLLTIAVAAITIVTKWSDLVSALTPPQ